MNVLLSFALGIIMGAGICTVLVTEQPRWLPGPVLSVKRVAMAYKTLWWDEAKAVTILEQWTETQILHPAGSALMMTVLASAPLLMGLRRYRWQQALAWTTPPAHRLTE